MQKVDEGKVEVLRNGSDVPVQILTTELVVGDVFLFSHGKKLPADALLLEGTNVICNESDQTGENEPVKKTPLVDDNWEEGAKNTLIAKSLVTSGSGKAIVAAVGYNTLAGAIARAANVAKP